MSVAVASGSAGFPSLERGFVGWARRSEALAGDGDFSEDAFLEVGEVMSTALALTASLMLPGEAPAAPESVSIIEKYSSFSLLISEFWVSG